MDLLRQHSDYAMRLMLRLAGEPLGQSVSVRVLADQEDVAYQFACKILQKLHTAGLVDSEMGTKGGYRLSRPADAITMGEVVVAMQGRPLVNRCTEGIASCPRQASCPVNKKLEELQAMLDDFLKGITLKELLDSASSRTDCACSAKPKESANGR